MKATTRSRGIAWASVALVCVPASAFPTNVQSAVLAGTEPLPLAAAEGWTRDMHDVCFAGQVLGSDGVPVPGAVVVTSAGGQTLTDRLGEFRLETAVGAHIESVQVTVVGPTAKEGLASRRVPLSSSPGVTPIAPLHVVQGGTCTPSWLPTFGGQPGLDGSVQAMTVFDDGTGPALYVGGFFDGAGGLQANNVAKWDGAAWSALGSGLNGTGVSALCTFDDGTGPALYAGGSFSTAGGVSANDIAKWDGSSWSALGSGMNGPSSSYVGSLQVFDSGAGDKLYAGGYFTTSGGVTTGGIAAWDGVNWASIGALLDGGFQGAAYTMSLFDDGGGEALYVGGTFTSVGGVPTSQVARWDGTSWSALGTGTNSRVQEMVVFDDGGGAGLFVAGSFTAAGGAPASHIAKWDGASWSSLGSGTVNGDVRALAVFDDGAGARLYAGGFFTSIGAVQAKRIAKWDGATWTNLASGLAGQLVDALAVFDDGGGAKLHAGGFFNGAGNEPVKNMATWSATGWAALAPGLDDEVRALALFDDGSGTALYAAGKFSTAGGTPVNWVAKWNGVDWSPLGSGIVGSRSFSIIRALEVFDDGSGEALYAGGSFNIAGGIPAKNIAKWNGSTWSPLGGGVVDPGVYSMASFDDGGGSDLYVGGEFTSAGGVPSSMIARWNGSSWSSVAGGGNSIVDSLAVFDDGQGPALFACGLFTVMGGVPAAYVAKWNGTNWSSLGSGLSSPAHVVGVHDDGTGLALIVGGGFQMAGGAPAGRIAKWNGSTWSTLGLGLDGTARSLATHDDGSGPALFVGGSFTSAGGLAANRIAKWDGAAWSNLGSGFDSIPCDTYDLAVYDDGGGAALYAGGSFASVLDTGESYLAKWACPPTAGDGNAYCFGDGTGTNCPCSANGNVGEGCMNTGGLGGASLSAGGTASLGNDTYRLNVFGVPGNKPGLVLRGANQLNGGFGNAVGDGLLCTGGQTARSQVQVTSTGSTVFTNFQGSPFGASSYGAGVPTNYQFWYRDPMNPCSGSGFNFSNAWTVVWQL